MQFPGREISPLVSRTRFRYPHVHGQAILEGFVDGRQRCTPLDRRQPTGVAVRHDIELLAVLDVLEELRAVQANKLTVRDVLRPQRDCLVEGGLRPRIFRQVRHGFRHLLQCPAQIHCRRTSRQQFVTSRVEAISGGIIRQRLGKAKSRGDADKRRAANLHIRDGDTVVVQCFQLAPEELVR